MLKDVIARAGLTLSEIAVLGQQYQEAGFGIACADAATAKAKSVLLWGIVEALEQEHDRQAAAYTEPLNERQRQAEASYLTGFDMAKMFIEDLLESLNISQRSSDED